MNSLIDICLFSIVLMNLLLVASSRLSAFIRIVALEGIVIGILPLIVHPQPLKTEVYIFVGATILLKGLIFPWFLSRAQREANVRREMEPLVSYPVSMLAYIFLFMISSWLSRRLPMPVAVFSPLAITVSFATILCGFFIIISRAKALTQVLGYLVIENGIYIFGVTLLLEQPLLVELAILLDIFVAVFVMGITIFHISREFDHIDTLQLSQLKDWTVIKKEAWK